MSEPAVYPSSAMERARKVQEVILRAIAGRLKWGPGRRDPRDLEPADPPVAAALTSVALSGGR